MSSPPLVHHRPPRQASAELLRLRDRVRAYEDEVEPWLRGVIATQVYRDHADWPVVRQKAEVIARSLEEIEPLTLPEDRILGIVYRRLRVHGGVGNYDQWRMAVKSPEFRGFREEWPVPEEVKQELRFWQTHPLVGRNGDNEARRRHGWLQKYGLAHPHGRVQGHTLPDHGILLESGISGLRRQLAERRRRPLTDTQRDELTAMDRCLEGMTAHAYRCAVSARAVADTADSEHLRRQLLEAADNCEALAVGPPVTFHQALQLLFWSNCADLLDNPGDASSFGRVDQLLYPFYAADLEAGRVTVAEAFDLVCRFLAKKWYCQTSNNLTVGGITPEGLDATNELSYLFLEALEATELTTNLSVRLHRGAPEAFRRTVARVIGRGFGRPNVYNDEVAIEALVRQGVELEDARDYAPLGCVEIMLPGRSAFRTMCCGMNLPKVLELVLHEGRCAVTGDQVWTEVPSRFASYEALVQEYHARVRQVVDCCVEIIREDERLESAHVPRPWLTVLSRGGIDAATDMTAGQPKYDPVGVTLDGVADVANSLYALKRLVFDEGRVLLTELREALRNDWVGHEALRAYVVNELPRYGQDHSEVDAVARVEAAHFADCFRDKETYYGGTFWPMIFGVSTGLVQNIAPKTGATPSGRRRGETLAMSLQPAAAGPQGGTTELLRSCAAIDFRDYAGGLSNVQEFDPALLAGERGTDVLVDLIRSFFELGGMELGPNFVSVEKLRAAQADPDGHSFLMVRLFGLSARFVDLTPQLQESVIERVQAASSRAM